MWGCVCLAWPGVVWLGFGQFDLFGSDWICPLILVGCLVREPAYRSCALRFEAMVYAT